jgi:hypothetical protein
MMKMAAASLAFFVQHQQDPRSVTLRRRVPGSPSARHKFSGDIKGLRPLLRGPKPPFLLASIARFLYPIVCLACERPRP